MASDNECKEGEKNSSTLPTVISDSDGWCVPFKNNKKDRKSTEDTGV